MQAYHKSTNIEITLSFLRTCGFTVASDLDPFNLDPPCLMSMFHNIARLMRRGQAAVPPIPGAREQGETLMASSASQPTSSWQRLRQIYTENSAIFKSGFALLASTAGLSESVA